MNPHEGPNSIKTMQATIGAHRFRLTERKARAACARSSGRYADSQRACNLTRSRVCLCSLRRKISVVAN